MLDKKTLNEFITKIDHAYQQFNVWICINNEFVKHQTVWNLLLSPVSTADKFSSKLGCKYKNFWDTVITSVQHAWILSLARLFDPAEFRGDKEKSRLSLEYIIKLLDDALLEKSIKQKIKKHEPVINSLKNVRDYFLAHNAINPTSKNIEAGIDKLFEELINIISDIRNQKEHLRECRSIDLKYIEALSEKGVAEIFESLTNN